MIDYFTDWEWTDASDVAYRFAGTSTTSANLVRAETEDSLAANLTTRTTDREKSFISVDFPSEGWNLSGTMTGKIFVDSESTIDWVDSRGAKVATWSRSTARAAPSP